MARERFRYRIAKLVALAAIALVIATVVELVLGRESERKLRGIETRYVPLIELDRDLKTAFAAIPRAYEDAAAANEEVPLAQAIAASERYTQLLVSAARTIAANGGDAARLQAGFHAYYVAAREVATSIVAGTPAAQIAGPIAAMVRAREAFETDLDLATTPNRAELAAAFATAREAHRTAFLADIAIALGALGVMGALSWALIRSTVRRLRDLSLGMDRLARGEFDRPIEAGADDELGDVAREANRTADRLRDQRAELEERTEEIARASKYKSEFLANMSHELRTPLNSIMTLSAVLADSDPPPDKRAELAKLIHRSGEDLLVMINDVLDLAKVESGKQSLTIEAVGVAELADYTRGMFGQLAAQRRLGFEVSIAPGLPGAIRSDRTRVHQIVKNLVSNALKFTERGHVSVRFARAPDDAISIEVTDTGIGIATEKQRMIFEAFAQADGGTSRTYGGTGLGLTIAKELAQRLGGRIEVESAPGAGSTFRVVLPIAGPPGEPGPPAIEPTPAPAGPVVARHPALAGKTVLIVDVDMRHVYTLSSALRANQLRVLTATDAREALEELDRHPDTDAVVIDIATPSFDGAASMRRIRDQFDKLPIIALAAHPTGADRERCLAAGASELLAKPLELGRLVELLRVHLH